MISTCVQFLESLICEECDACIWDNAQNSWSEASVKGLHTFFLGDSYEHMHDVAVPESTQNIRRQVIHHSVLVGLIIV